MKKENWGKIIPHFYKRNVESAGIQKNCPHKRIKKGKYPDGSPRNVCLDCGQMRKS